MLAAGTAREWNDPYNRYLPGRRRFGGTFPWPPVFSLAVSCRKDAAHDNVCPLDGLLLARSRLSLLRCGADDFAVENSVFEGKRRLGGSQTIFLDGKVYDFLADSSEAAVFDLAAGRVALCDSLRRVRTELTTQELADFAMRLRDRCLPAAQNS